jgi:hypothetical protein
MRIRSQPSLAKIIVYLFLLGKGGYATDRGKGTSIFVEISRREGLLTSSSLLLEFSATGVTPQLSILFHTVS